MAARFNVLPSDYMRTHDWNDLCLDYLMAKELNKIDQMKHEAELKALYGKKK